MRTKYSIYNVASGMFAQVVTVLLGFISRKVFVITLGMSLQGINATLSSVITMLSLTELGIGTAIICNLYKPLAADDRPKVTALMQFYSRVYTAIAGIVLVLGVCVCPFLSLIVNDNSVSKSYLIKVFLLFLAETVISYLFAYKRSILIADQKNFYVNLVVMAANLLNSGAQIAVLLLTKNFILYLVIKICFRFLENIAVAAISNKKYPYLKKADKIPVDAAIKHNIVSNTKALALHYVGNYLISGTDMMIITKFLGTVTSGIYSNYLLITTTLKTVFSQFSSGITAGFGNLIALGETQKLYTTFRRALFICYVMTNFATVSLFCLFNPFISIWLGGDYTFSVSVVLIICLNFFIESLSEPIGALRASAGLFRPDRYLHLILAALNLVISIILVRVIGIFGVFLGTLICHIIKELTVLPIIVYKNLFEMRLRKYQLVVLVYMLVTAGCTALTSWICGFVAIGNPYLNLIVRCIVCVLVPNAIVVLCFFKTDEFRYAVDLAGKILKKICKPKTVTGE